MKSSIWKTITRRYCSFNFCNIMREKKSKFPKPSLPIENLLNNLEDIKKEIRLRKDDAFLSKLNDIPAHISRVEARQLLESIAFALPNRIHPAVKDFVDDYRVIKTVGHKENYSFEPLSGTELLQDKDLLFMAGNLNQVCGERSYYFIGDSAVLEQALIDYTVEKLLTKHFHLLSVPDVLTKVNIESCGMLTIGERNHVYKLDPKIAGEDWCLSGTSEMAIAAYLMNRSFEEKELPKLYAAVSRCYRAEMSATSAEKGLYRVHQFTKVEMFAVCLPDQSEAVLESFLNIQEELFSSYGLHYRVLDMAAHELGRQAYRKFDVEVWMPGSKRFGEVSSCSDCTDYQSRRLNIRHGETFLHTVNGTACAIPRTINAICETFQIEKGRILIPKVLQPYTRFEVLGMKRGPRFHKVKKHFPTNL